MIFVRYADDYTVGFQHKEDAERFLHDLTARLARFGLGLHPDKTRLIEFGRFAAANRAKRGQGKPDTFDFLGMTHVCARNRSGTFRVGRRPSRKRVRRTLRRIKESLHRRQHEDMRDTARWLGRVINGWLNYYAVPGTSYARSAFAYRVMRLFMRSLRRRSQKDRTAWPIVSRLCRQYWPSLRTRHPWPAQRLTVTT